MMGTDGASKVWAGESATGIGIEAAFEHFVLIPERSVKDDDLDFDIDESRVAVTLRGSVQHLLDIVDALMNVHVVYGQSAHRDASSNTQQARDLVQKGARMMVIAHQLEIAVLNASRHEEHSE